MKGADERVGRSRHGLSQPKDRRRLKGKAAVRGLFDSSAFWWQGER